MTKYVVTGGVPLRGKITLHGAKNAGFKAMIAALLADSPSTICDLGLISEIEFAKQVISQLGGKVTASDDPHCLTVDPTGLHSFSVQKDLSVKSRFSIMYVGPLLARFGQVDLPAPGGDTVIGKRPLDRHLAGLQGLGAKVNFNGGIYHFEAKNGLVGANYKFSKSTHNGTEVLIMAAVKAKGTTVLQNAAAEPEIDDLIKFLNSMGAKITRVKPRVIKIVGVDKLHGAKHTVMKDRNEVVTFTCAALATKGEVTVENANRRVLEIFLHKLEEIGAGIEYSNSAIKVSFRHALMASDVTTGPYPAFMTDWQPLWATLMTQANGQSVIHETVYERRFDFVPALIKMGAKIDFFQPNVADPDTVYNFNLEDDSPENKHAIRISGPTKLHSVEIEVNDIRSGATALLAGVAASGTTTVLDPRDQIKRGYEDLAGGLVSLGAKIKIES